MINCNPPAEETKKKNTKYVHTMVIVTSNE